MHLLYNILIRIVNGLLPIAGVFNDKLKHSIVGRKTVFETLQQKIDAKDRVFWFHCASLGEYEQGVPVMEVLKEQYPECKLLITFFSPSGYEVKKHSTLADYIVYLPFDTKKNAKRFVELVNPEIAIFIKYEFWPNYLKELKNQKIPVLFISTAFRNDQIFFKWYGGFMRNILQSVSHFFVQDSMSLTLLNSIGFDNATLSGDTRFDRVSHQIEMDNTLDFVADFVGQRLCIVAGSTWTEDEAILLDYINQAPDEVCFVIAPHEIKGDGIASFREKILRKSVLFSEKGDKNLVDYQILIVDAIGYLTRIYSYADIAYVGGGMGHDGLHNILEPATFGIPIIIGKNFEKFIEAKQLQKLAGLFSVSNSTGLTDIMTKLTLDKKFREKTGMIAGHFINSNTGATAVTIDYILKLLPVNNI